MDGCGCAGLRRLMRRLSGVTVLRLARTGFVKAFALHRFAMAGFARRALGAMSAPPPSAATPAAPPAFAAIAIFAARNLARLRLFVRRFA